MKIKTTLFHNGEFKVYLTPETEAERTMLELMMDNNKASWGLERETYHPRAIKFGIIHFRTEEDDPSKPA